MADIKFIISAVDRFSKTFNRAQKQMAELESQSSDLVRSLGRNGLFILAPGSIPILAGAVGLMGALVPQVAVLAGAGFATASAFAVAGAGVAAFGALAVTTLNDVFEASSDIADLQKELAVTDDLKERAKIMEEISIIQRGLTSGQKEALTQLDALKSKWQALATRLEAPTLEVFAKAMKGLTGLLELAEPIFVNATHAMSRLMDIFNQQLKSEDFRAFFDWMGTAVAPAIETVGTAMMNFMIGFMNLMRAFGGLSTDMQDGLLGMSTQFRNFTATLDENQQFQSFIAYVRENLPKLKDIFGDVVVGLTGMFTAFGGLSGDMITDLQTMTQKFREWGQSLSENEGFKSFIAYVRENAPTVLSFIGNLVTTFINLAVALAPVGTKVLEVANNILAFMGSLLQTNPWLAKFFAWFAIGVSVVNGLTTVVLLIVAALARVGMTFKILLSVIKPVWNFLRIGRILMLALTSPIGIVIAAVGLLVFALVKLWKHNETFRNIVKSVWEAIKNVVTTVIDWVKEKFVQLVARVAVMKQKFEEFRKIMKIVFQNAKQAVIDFVVKAIQKFVDIKNAVTEKMNSVRDKIESAWDSAISFLQNINLFSIGADIVSGLIRGIGSMFGALGRKVGDLASKVTSGIKGLLNINSPSKVLEEIGQWTGEGFVNGIANMIDKVGKVSRSMGSVALESVQVGQADMSAAGTAAGRYAVAAQTKRNSKQPEARPSTDEGAFYYFEIPVVVDGREIGRASAKYTQEEIERAKVTRSRASGKRAILTGGNA